MRRTWFLKGAVLLLLSAFAACDDADTTDPSMPDASQPDSEVHEDTETGDAPDLLDEEVDDSLPSWWGERGETCGNGVCDEGETEEGCPEDCAEAPVALFDPFADDVHYFPHDFLTVPDASTPTGLRVNIRVEDFPRLRRYTSTAIGVLEDLAELDGFGWVAGGYVRFSKPVDPATLLATDGETADEAGASVIAGYLDEEGRFVRQPIEVLSPGPGRVAIFRPMFATPPGARAVFALTTDVTDAEGRPLRPSPWLASALEGEAAGPLSHMQERFDDTVAALVDAGAVSAATDIAALLPFTAQSADEADARIREDLQGRQLAWRSDGCQVRQRWRLCDVVVTVPNYRGEDRRSVRLPGEGSVGEYALPLAVYLPLESHPEGEGLEPFSPPYRTVLFGHGLAGDRYQASQLADRAAERGIAVIAIDAPEHGDHPWRSDPDGGQISVVNFLGFKDNTVDGIFLRDNWRQAVWDKLGILQALRQGLDVTGDGVDDLTLEDFGYLGASLGTIMGPQFLAWADEVSVAVLTIGGARISDILQFSEEFASLFRVLAGPGRPMWEIATLYPVLQTVLERGDPAYYSAHLTRDRLIDAPPMQVLKAMAFQDEVVPDETNILMARLMGLTHVPPVLRPVGHIPVAEERVLSGNMPDGGTAGYLQFDLITRNGQWEPTNHSRLPANAVGLEAWFHFLGTLYETGVGEIIDPYDRLGYMRP